MKRSNISKKADPDLAGSSPEEALTAGAPGARITASVEPLALVPGLYLFSVRSTSLPTQVGGLLLPAMQVGSGPGSSADGIEIMQGPGMSGAWLCQPGDRLVAKISKAAPVLLTSIRAPDMTPLLVEVENLDARKGDAAVARPAILPVPPVDRLAENAGVAHAQSTPASEMPEIPLQIVAHIQNRGDVPFINAPWAGLVGQRLAIEGFSVTPLRKIAAVEVECKALSASRSETPWVSGGELCGTRGKGLPLIGFCIRVKPQADGKRYDCEYSGTFASGKVAGPARNGAPCWSVAPGDFLEAIQIKITERVTPEAASSPD